MDRKKEALPKCLRTGNRTYKFTPTPTGTRWYHTHTMSMDDLHRGSFTGMFGFLIVEGANNPGNFESRNTTWHCAIRSLISPTP